MNAPQHRRRWYDLTLETLSPLHTSLGPDALLVPSEECDVDGERIYVLDRAALIADLQVHPPPPPPAPKRRTYRDILRDPNETDLAKSFARQQVQAGWIKLDDPVDEEGGVPDQPAAPDWAALAATQPQHLPREAKRWREPGGAHLIRYELTGTLQTPQGQWWETVSRLPRTPDGRMLLPGSGLKGALRSVLAYAMAEQVGVERLPERDPKYAAQPLERRTLAPTAAERNAPNYDAGRLLLVRDTPFDSGVIAGITPFGLISTRGWRPFVGGTQQAAAAVEAVPPGVIARARLGIDTFLLDHWREGAVEVFAPLRPVLTADLAPLLAAGRAFARAQLAEDQRFYQAASAPRAAELTAALLQRLAALPPNAMLLRVGWGAGRWSKTPFGVLLHRLNRDQYAPQRSRRLSWDRRDEPGLPFGWVLCTVTSAE